MVDSSPTAMSASRLFTPLGEGTPSLEAYPDPQSGFRLNWGFCVVGWFLGIWYSLYRVCCIISESH